MHLKYLHTACLVEENSVLLPLDTIAGITILFTFWVINCKVWYEENTTSLLDKPFSVVPGNTHVQYEVCVCVYIYICIKLTQTPQIKIKSSNATQEKFKMVQFGGDWVVNVFWKHVLFDTGKGLSTTVRTQSFQSSRPGSCGARAQWHSSGRARLQPHPAATRKLVYGNADSAIILPSFCWKEQVKLT